MSSLREEFGLEEYTKKAVDTVVRMQTKGGASIQEMAEAADISVEDVEKIVSATFQVWGH
ncbi:MAG: hypothetical protein NC251_04520 [Lachnoclostridium sp.]|nr:hypothetical protein [Lachnospira sp.]MCM1247676.1 hypothetical protein [Lachnoclostridium sp.]MCM1535064.1 hypothetical protein [Clostridium sp.]